MKTNTAVVFIVNQKYLFALGTMLFNLKDISPDAYDTVVVYYDGFSDFDIQSIQNIEPKAEFIEYSYAKWCFEHREPNSKWSKSFINRYSHLTLIKYKIMEQLRTHKRVLYLDLDMLVKGGVRELYTINKPAWRNGLAFQVKIDRFYKGSSLEFDDIPEGLGAPNAGLLYFTDSFDYEQCLLDAKNFVYKHLDDFSNNLDEITISWALYKNKVDVKFLDKQEFNVLLPDVNKSSKIIHFMGGMKPWSSSLIRILFPQWFIYHNNYIKAVGQSFDSLKYDDEYEVLGVAYSAIWSKVLTVAKFNPPDELRSSFDLSGRTYSLKYSDNISYELSIDLLSLRVNRIGLRLSNIGGIARKDVNKMVDQLKQDVSGCRVHVEVNSIYISIDTITKHLDDEFSSFFSKTFPHVAGPLNTVKYNYVSELQEIKNTFRQLLSLRKGFQKVWVFRNQVVAVDFIIADNRIAFDILLDSQARTIQCWFFCRNSPDIIHLYAEEFLELKGDKGLICSMGVEELQECVLVLSGFLDRI